MNSTRNELGMDASDSRNDAIFNSMTEKRNTVQLRTGLFEACVPLPKLTGNLGLGPEIDISLFYSPLTNNVAGLGDGWSFAMTTYDKHAKKLRLHTGEVFHLEFLEVPTHPGMVVRWRDDGATLEIERKNGRVETLKAQYPSPFWTPVRLTCDGYRYVALTWDTNASGIRRLPQLRLTGIRNDMSVNDSDSDAVKAEAQRQLLTVTYIDPALLSQERDVRITLWPGSNEALTYCLFIRDFALAHVALSDDWDPKARTLGYEEDRRCGWLLTEIANFDGTTERVVYAPETRKFPDDRKLEWLPCVTQHIMTPRGGGPDVVTQYAYAQNENVHPAVDVNRLDAPPDVFMEDFLDADDQMKRGTSGSSENEPIAYTTTVTEKSVSGDRTTVYSYGVHHSLVREVTTRGQSMITRTFSSGKDGTTTRTQFRRGSACRDELSSCRMTDGVLSSTTSRGLTTRFEFEADAGFKDTYLSREVSDDLTETLLTHTSIFGFNRKRPTCSRRRLDMSEASPFVRQEIDYFETDDFRKGLRRNVRQGVEAGDPMPLSVARTGSTSYDYALAGTALTTTTSDVHGGATRTTSRTVSILSGRVISEVDAAGNRTEYEYHADTGQLGSSLACAGSSAYEQRTSYSYPSVGRIEITEPGGRLRAVESDGRDNVISEAVAIGEAWVTLSETRYDDLGRKSLATRFDTAGAIRVREDCSFTYDDWGQVSCATYSDGHSIFNEFDPVFLIRDEWEGLAGDRHRKRTAYNLDESICFVTWLDSEGKPYQQEHHSYRGAHPLQVATSDGKDFERRVHIYDGLGRLTGQDSWRGSRTTGLVANPDAAGGLRCLGTVDASREGQTSESNDGIAIPSGGTLARSTVYSYRADDFLGNEPTEITLFDAESLYARSPEKRQSTSTMPAAGDTVGRSYVRTLGRREFDALGRVTSVTRAGITEVMTYSAGMPAPSTVTRGDGSTLTYEYIPELGYRPGKVKGAGNAEKAFSYMHGSTLSSGATEGPAALACKHDSNGRVTEVTVSASAAVSRRTTRQWSEGGRLLGETDASGGATTFSYNEKGQRTLTRRDSGLQTDHRYDTSGRLSSENVALGGDTAVIAYTYDAMHRESGRTFTLPDATVLSLTREYFTDGKLKSVRLTGGAGEIASRSYAYDFEGRVVSSAMTGTWRPKNPRGKDIDGQAFTYDALGNVLTCVTRFGTEVCNSVYAYDASGCRLLTVTNDHSDYKARATLSYDGNGQLTRDASGKTYAYDWLGRLIQAGSRYYTYDGMDRLMTCGTASEKRQVLHDDTGVRGEYGAGDEGRYFYPGSAACSIQRVKRSGVDRTLFELFDSEGTVVASYDMTAKAVRHHAFTAYGEHSSDETDSLLGYRGAYRDTEVASGADPVVDRYPLGQGYRWYVPGQMQFQAPDSESPFGAGGWQPYGYCDGDPINRADPTGHSWALDALGVASLLSPYPVPVPAGVAEHQPAWLKTAVRIGEAVAWGVAAVAGAVFTGGASLLLIGIAVTLATASAVTGIVAAVLADSDPETAAVLNWISFGTGLASGVTGANGVARLGSLARRGGRWIQGVIRSGVGGTSRAAARGGARVAGRSVRQIVGDALGALPKPRQSLRSQLLERVVNPLKVYAGETVLLTTEAVTGVLANAGVFESGGGGEALNQMASRSNLALEIGTSEFSATQSLVGRMRTVPRRVRLRFR